MCWAMLKSAVSSHSSNTTKKRSKRLMMGAEICSMRYRGRTCCTRFVGDEQPSRSMFGLQQSTDGGHVAENIYVMSLKLCVFCFEKGDMEALNGIQVKTYEIAK